MHEERPRSHFRFSLAGLMGSIFLLAVMLAMVRVGIITWWSATVVGVQIFGGAVGGFAGLMLRGQSGFAPGVLFGVVAITISAPTMYVVWLFFNVPG